MVKDTPKEAIGEAEGTDSAPAAPHRRTRSRAGDVAEEPQADVVADLSQEIDGASGTAEGVVKEEEWRWRAVPGAPSLPRWGHSVTRVGDGQLFILGGENADECFNSGHIYQHAEGSWSFDPIPARQVLSPHSCSCSLAVPWQPSCVCLLTASVDVLAGSVRAPCLARC